MTGHVRIIKFERELYCQHTRHFHDLARKNWHKHKEEQEKKLIVSELYKKEQAVNAALRGELQHYKAALHELTHYIPRVEEVRLRQLLMLRWRFNGNQYDIEDGKVLLESAISNA